MLIEKHLQETVPGAIETFSDGAWPFVLIGITPHQATADLPAVSVLTWAGRLREGPIWFTIASWPTTLAPFFCAARCAVELNELRDSGAAAFIDLCVTDGIASDSDLRQLQRLAMRLDGRPVLSRSATEPTVRVFPLRRSAVTE